MNTKRHGLLSFLGMCASCLLNAQSGSIAGVVKDSSDAVVAGVTVEASSPALIERLRTTVTNDQGLYKIIDLRPGIYTVTFTLPGFNTVRREGIEITTSFTATVNGNLAPGSVGETVTVSAESPALDTQNAVVQKTFSSEVLNSLPLGKSASVYTTFIPGAISSTGAQNQDVGGTKGENTQGFRIHGSLIGDFQQLRDGMFFGTLVAAGNFMTSTNPSAVEETVVEISGFTADAATGGGHVNIVPKQGGNQFHGAFKYDQGTAGLQSTNIDAALLARGATASTLRKVYDAGGGFGGPIVKDKLWFFVSSRYWTSSSFQPGNYFNKTQGTIFYTPDLTRPAYDVNYYREMSARLTWQASPRNKFSGSYSRENNCNCFYNIGTGTLAPEATGDDYYKPNYRVQGTWTSPVTSKLLLWAGATVVSGRVNRIFTGGTGNDISITDQTRGYTYGSSGTGLGLITSWGYQSFFQANENFSASYVTGGHSLKFGITEMQGKSTKDSEINGGLAYNVNVNQATGAVTPASVTYWATPFLWEVQLRSRALYASDQWRLKRLTLNYGLRYDAIHGNVPANHLPAGPFVPARDFDAVSSVPNWKDLNPRIAGAWDVFGNGKTAVKASIARSVNFEASGGYTFLNSPANTIVTSATRSWTDGNGDFVPQSSELGALSNVNFGKAIRSVNYSDDVVKGFGNRGYNWTASLSLQQELKPGLVLSFGFYRTWFGNFAVARNLAVSPSDYNSYCITVPTDARLPNGGGNQNCNLYDISAAKKGQFDYLVEPASKYGEQRDVYTGIDVNISTRFRKLTLAGGVSAGHEVTDNCFVVNSPQDAFYTMNYPQLVTNSPQIPPPALNDFYSCHIEPPWYSNLQFKILGVYQLPWHFRISGNLQNLPSIPFLANMALPAGKSGVNGVPSVELVVPNTVFHEGRNNQIDLRLSREFAWERFKIQPTFDVFNALNANPVLGTNNRIATLSAAGVTSVSNRWQNATAVLGARIVKFGVQVEF